MCSSSGGKKIVCLQYQVSSRFVTVIQCTVIIYNIYHNASETYYFIIKEPIICVSEFCNIFIWFQFINLIFMVKQRYIHLNKRLDNWISGTVSRQIYLKKENERHSQSDRAVGHVIITPVCV